VPAVPDNVVAAFEVVRRVNWCKCLKAHGDHSLGSGGDGERIGDGFYLVETGPSWRSLRQLPLAPTTSTTSVAAKASCPLE
jgi:hypothetical protein